MVDAIHYLAACKVFVTEAKEILDLCRDAERKPMVIPGLLQTRRYARMWIERSPGLSQEDIDAAVRLREDRQQILHQPRPGRFIFFMHEQALRFQIGTKATMHEQLLKLVLLAALPHVSVRVLPALAGERALVGGPFQLFEYREHQPLVYLDHACSGAFLEDQEFVAGYQQLLSRIRSVALDEAKSRAFMAELADALDQRSTRRDAGIYEVEEEQL